MKRTPFSSRSRQRGLATLTISALILFLITMLTLYAAGTSITEQRVSANQYRADQALSAANAALDYGMAYYEQGGIDHGGDGSPDFTPAAPRSITIAAPGGTSSNTAKMYFCGRDASGTIDPAMLDLTDEPACTYTAADPTVANTYHPANGAVVVAVGYSDDTSGRRIVTQSVGGIEVIGSGGPDRPLIAHGAVQVTGNITLINRFTNASVWSGKAVNIGMSASAMTYLRDGSLDADDLTHAQKVDPDWRLNAVHASGRDRGNNADVAESDPFLAALSGDAFWDLFVTEGKDTIRAYAQSRAQAYDADAADSPDLDGLDGLIWVTGDFSINGDTIGSVAAPAILIVDGDLSTGGNISITGVLYVTGDWTTGGTVDIRGTAIVEGATVHGAGTTTIVYDAEVVKLGHSQPPISGRYDGTWRDW